MPERVSSSKALKGSSRSSTEGRKALEAACPSPDILVNNNGGPPPKPFGQLDRAAIMAEFPPAKLGEGMRASLGRLRDSRRRIGLSLRDLASKAGMDPKALSLLERGIGNPTLATVDRVARVGDLWADLLGCAQSLQEPMRLLDRVDV